MKRHTPTYLTIALVAAAAMLAPTAARADEYWDQKTSLYGILPIFEDDIVFLGNSITDGGEFSELFGMPNIKNRGIRSDVITGVEKRIGQVTGGRPKKIFLLIGINDVSHGHSVDELARRYERLVKRIREESPQTRLYLQSVMPINNSFKRYKNLAGKEQTVRDFNEHIRAIAAAHDAEYIDLQPLLQDANGNLRRELTNDGLHLNGRGYRIWTDGIRKYVVDDADVEPTSTNQ